MVPLEERSRLLTFWDLLYREFCDGKWVRCRHGLYHDDIDLICEHDNLSKAELIVTFILRIPKHSGSAQKCKQPGHPEPGKWSTDWAKAVWGNKVRKILDEEYELKDETYKSCYVTVGTFTRRGLDSISNDTELSCVDWSTKSEEDLDSF